MRCPILYSITLRQRSSWDLHAPPVPPRVAALRPLARAPRAAAPGRPAKPVQAPCRASYDRVYWFAAAPKPPPAAAFLDSRLLSVAPTTSFGKLARAASAMRLSSGL